MSAAPSRPHRLYLRIQPPFRPGATERQLANHKALAQLERYLAARAQYRDGLDNPAPATIHSAAPPKRSAAAPKSRKPSKRRRLTTWYK